MGMVQRQATRVNIGQANFYRKMCDRPVEKKRIS